jgi:glutamate formiminotransferase
VSRTIVECVPNFSEGRDASKVDAIVAAIRSVPGVAVLDREMDADHNRSVVTFAAPAETVGEAAIRGVEKAVALIDLNRHRGVHPRIGAADVVPFVPVEGVTLQDCVRIAECTGAELWRRLRLPIYLYEAAARHPDRVNLENIRKGGFEGLRAEVRTNPARRPDFGEAELHPTAGATVVGARKFLIAYNINLDTADLEIAKRIARVIRTSCGGLPCVKAMGVPLASRKLVQVSMNLTDFEQTPMHLVFEAVRAEAARDGIDIAGSEIIGLVPNRALAMSAGFYLKVENFRPELILENRLAVAETGGRGLKQFLDAVAAGCNAAAAAGALAATLGCRVAVQAKLDSAAFDAARRFFSQASERPDGDVSQEAARLKENLRRLRTTAPAELHADIDTAIAIADAIGLT